MTAGSRVKDVCASVLLSLPAALPPAALLPDEALLLAAAALEVATDEATDEAETTAEEETVAAEETTAEVETEPAPAAELDATPAAARRASRSDWVVHVMEVPGELTRGRAAQLYPEISKGILNAT